jgi:PIN domain nuclease of toxin-antitoxin system
MRILLDSTYLMPSIGVQVNDIPTNTLSLLREGGHTVAISDITLLELSAKGAKHVASGKLSPERVSRGVQAVQREEGLEKIRHLDMDVLRTAIALRGILDDYLDCVILSSAINRCDTLLTEDSRIHSLVDNKGFMELVKKINPEFKLASHRALPGLV